MSKIVIERHHDFCAGHRVYGHENKCGNLHGHNYRVTFTVSSDNELDSLGRVVDFSVVKEKLCNWLEEHWDHKMLLWQDDPIIKLLPSVFGVVQVPFNPTAENMALWLLQVIAPFQLKGTGCTLIRCKIQETYKCSATAEN